MKGIITLIFEHDAPYILQRHIALEMVLGVYHRKNVSFRLRDHIHQFPHGGIYPHCNKIGLDKVIGLEESEHSLIAVMGMQLSFLGYTLGVD